MLLGPPSGWRRRSHTPAAPLTCPTPSAPHTTLAAHISPPQEEDDTYVADVKLIARKYWRTHLLVDLFAVLPFELVLAGVDDGGLRSLAAHTLRFNRLFQCSCAAPQRERGVRSEEGAGGARSIHGRRAAGVARAREARVRLGYCVEDCANGAALRAASCASSRARPFAGASSRSTQRGSTTFPSSGGSL